MENSDEQIKEIENQLKQQLATLESVAKQKMSKEAISRYGSLKIAHHETAIRAIAFIAQAVTMGQIKENLSDNDFKSILKEIQQGKKEFKIRK